MAVVDPTDRPKSVCNRCAIEIFGGALCCQLDVEFSVGIRTVVIELSQISFFFSELREKVRNLTQSYDKSPYTHKKNPKSNVTTQKNATKTSITQRLRKDLLRRSV